MEERMTGAYAAVKYCQQVLVTMLDMKIPDEARSKVSEVMAELAHARDELVVLRENMHRLEFDNAALREQLRAQESSTHVEEPAPRSPARRREADQRDARRAGSGEH